MKLLLYFLSPVLCVSAFSGDENISFEKASKYFSAKWNSEKSAERRKCLLFLTKSLAADNEIKSVKMACKLLDGEFLREEGKLSNEYKISISVLNEFLKYVSSLKSKEALNFLAGEVSKPAGTPLKRRYQLYIITGLGFHKTSEVIGLFDLLLKSDSSFHHVAVANALAIKPSIDDLELLFRMLEGGYTWEAKLVALEIIQKINDKSLAGRLVNVLRKKDLTTRVRMKIVEILKSFTDVKLETDSADMWENVLKGQTTGTEVVTVIEPIKVFQVRVYTNRIIFLLDASLSMFKDPSRTDITLGKSVGSKSEAESTAATGQQGEPIPEIVQTDKLSKDDLLYYEKCKDLLSQWRTKKIETKFEQLQKEMLRVLYMMPADTQFNIVWFQMNYFPWKSDLVTASWQVKESAMNFVISGCSPAGLTGISNVLLYSFKLKAARGSENKTEEFLLNTSIDPFDLLGDADSFILLTDGNPTYGAIISTDDIFSYVKKLNAVRKISINTIAFGVDADSDFLEILAEENYGQFYFCKW
ncbi:MAG: hypothetical protein HY606_09270 [Planctomycetes bacterium]|nr:hypothetical protein [Planctomycetota bacterium]